MTLAIPFIEQNSVPSEAIIYEGYSFQMIVPERPLAKGSIEFRSDCDFVSWKEQDHLEMLNVMQKVAEIWKQQGITDYLRFAQVSEGKFSWEMVPCPSENWQVWNGIKLLWKATFGAGTISLKERENQASFLKEQLLRENHPDSNERKKGTDVFCQESVIGRQLVYDGVEDHVLYNYAPVAAGKEKLHFLIIPKNHCPSFSLLNQREYLEAMRFSQKLIAFYRNQGIPKAFLLDKTGPAAGQTVFHWHEHLILIPSKTEELWSRLTMFKNMFIHAAPLSNNELKERVSFLKKDLCKLDNYVFAQ